MPPETSAEIRAALEALMKRVDDLCKCITGNGNPEQGFIIRVDRIERFLQEELGYGEEREQRPIALLAKRVTRLENIIYPILFLVSPISIWAVIEILNFLRGILFHTAPMPTPPPTPTP